MHTQKEIAEELGFHRTRVNQVVNSPVYEEKFLGEVEKKTERLLDQEIEDIRESVKAKIFKNLPDATEAAVERAKLVDHPQGQRTYEFLMESSGLGPIRKEAHFNVNIPPESFQALSKMMREVGEVEKLYGLRSPEGSPRKDKTNGEGKSLLPVQSGSGIRQVSTETPRSDVQESGADPNIVQGREEPPVD